MHKIKKYQFGKSLDINYQLPSVNKLAPNLPSLTTTTLMPPNMPLFKGSIGNHQINDIKNLNFKIDERFNKPNTTSIIAKNLGDLFVNFLSGTLSDGLIGDDSELGRSVGNIMSGALGTAGSTIIDNISKGNVITEGLQKNVGSTVSGIAGGLAANYAGQGISSLMGNSNLGKFTGGATSSVLGLILGGGIGNPYAFGMNVLGSGLSAMTGPSKEYGGRYGNVTQTLDGIYNTAAGLVGTINPLAGGIMTLNKGLSNIFGSTSGMTIQDSILGSAFMPAPVKWLNMAGASKTGTFKNQSWQNTEKADSFMQNAFGNLGDKFRQAAEEAGKTYGTFSHGAKNRALDNINFANYAWNKVLAMADLNELQNIRSLYMTSINNLRYALNIQGGWNPLAVGKQGMKILNNATNHNMGMRLLSAAALIDNKQMILSALTGTKLYGAKKFRAMSEEELKNRKPEIVVSQTTPKTPEELNAEWERTHPNGGNADPNLSRVSDLTSEVFNQTTKPPFTGQEYLEAAEAQRLKKLDKFHEAEKIGEATLMADMAVSAAPLLLRGFRWAFNRAGLLVKVPMQRTNLFLTSPYTGKWTLFGNREYRFKPGYAAMNGVPVESRPVNTVRLYRATGTNGNFEASLDGGQEFAGQWFTNDPTKPQYYASMTVKRARRAGVNNPIELLYVDIPESELSKYKASEILKGRTDIEYEPTEDFLIPLDYPRLRVPLEGYTGNLLLDARRPLPELDKPITPEGTVKLGPINKFTTAKSIYNEGNMSDLEIYKAAGDGFKEAIVAYKPGGVWYERQIANGIPKEEVDRLASEYLNSLYNTTITIDRSTLSDAVAVALPRIEGGNIKSTLIMDPRYTKNYLLVKDAAVHETGHASTKNIEPINSSYRTPEAERYYQLAEESSPETKEAMEYNETLRPEIKDSALDEILLDESGNAERHFRNVAPQQEIRQRAFAAELDATNKGVTVDEYINNPKLWDLNFKLLAEIFDMETLKYYMKHYKTIVFPLIGGSTAATLYNTNK